MTQPPQQVSICGYYYGLDSVCYRCGDRRLTPGADDVVHIDPMDIRNTEQRDPGSSAGECLFQYRGPDTNKMMTDSFLQVLMIYPTWTLQVSEIPSSRVPVQVSACVQYHDPVGVHYQGGDQLSTGADDMLHLDSVDVRNTEKRHPGSSAGECLWQNIIDQT